MTPTDILELISGKTRYSVTEMIANERPLLIDEALDHEFQSATLSTQGRIRTVLYDVVEQELLDLIRQDV